MCVIAAVLALPLAGCGSGERSGDDSLRKVLESGELVLGLDEAFPPMGFIDENGETVGFDIDVAEEVCRRLGVKLVKRGIVWEEKEDDLNSGKIDCIWNGFSVTAEREEVLAFSEPYMKNELIFVVPGASEVKSVRELGGKTIGVQAGSTAEEELKKAEIFPTVTMKTYDTIISMIEHFYQGETDAVLIDSVAAYYYIFSAESQCYILSVSLSEEEYAVGFRKADIALRDRIQEILSEMKADGTLGAISKKWFGSDITTVK